MKLNQILKVLSLIHKHQLKSLLMGGQACVLYGAAEFSKDLDLAILLSDQNLSVLERLMTELQAEVIAVPQELSSDLLRKGHAVHFRCRAPEAYELRVDIMSKMRGLDEFESLWQRRTSIDFPISSGGTIEVQVMGLWDLVKAKKTQRDKDWPMIRRLVEVNYLANRSSPKEVSIDFWLKELRTPPLLVELVQLYPLETDKVKALRPAIDAALRNDLDEVAECLMTEEKQERDLDKKYWEPLKRELAEFRKRK